MNTIAQQLNIKEFPFRIKDKNGKQIYYEDSDGGGVNGNTVLMESVSTLKPLKGTGVKENTIPMEI